MIVRLLNEGQYRASDELRRQLSQLDDQAMTALERADEEELDRCLEEMWQLVKAQGDELPVDELTPSDVIIPPPDLTLEETSRLFAEDGLIPDLPAA